MTKNEKKKVVILSYFPNAPLTAQFTEDPDKVKGLLNQIPEPPHILGCAWCVHQEKISPVFLLKDSESVLDHLVKWSEDKPEDWFKLCIFDEGDHYHITLWPDVIKSKDRYIMNHLHLHGEILTEDDHDFNMIFAPLHFMSPVSGFLTKAKEMGLFKDRMIYLGFSPSQKDEPKFIGPFHLVTDDKIAKDYVNNIHKSAEE